MIGVCRRLKRPFVECIGHALAVEPIEAVGVCWAREQFAVFGIGDLKNVSARTVTRAKPFLIGNGVENGNFEGVVFECEHDDGFL